jgi:chondroitin 4-sulfotransferase 11
MLINHEKKFIFIHVQKTAGISIESQLKESLSGTEVLHGRHGRVVDGIGEIGLDEWEKYYSFAFVRNPWDRMVSWYCMIQDAKINLPLYKKWFKHPFKSELWNYAITHSDNFESFIENCTEVVFDLGCYKSFAFNQIDYLTDDKGNIAVDFIGKFEELDKDFAKVCAHLKLDNILLSKKNQSKHLHYSSYYSEHSINIIKKRFARDIEAFGYTFDYTGFKS